MKHNKYTTKGQASDRFMLWFSTGAILYVILKTAGIL